MENILPLIEYGHKHFGENKVQETLNKWSNIKNQKPHIKLHMIGRLQSNKLKHAVSIFDYIHSVDNYKLAKKISEEEKKIGKKLKHFIQVNIGNEMQKIEEFCHDSLIPRGGHTNLAFQMLLFFLLFHK